MSLRGFDAFFSPRSIALIGPSEREGSVGRAVATNLFGSGFDGPILPVHPRLDTLHGGPVYRDVASLPVAPDLAVIATPAPTVPELVAQLGERGARAVVVLSAGFRERGPEGAALERAVLAAARPRGVRIMGPNCIGFMAPAHGVNASFAHLTPRAGDLAFVSQSGAMVAALLDWAADRAVGFSRVVSLGNMSDVDLGDLLDDLALDGATRAILLYVEAIASARKLMSAARAAARKKPVLVIKAGSVAEAARAARAHTGAGAIDGATQMPAGTASVATSDAVYDAAFRRAGMLRVRTVAELFDAAETLARSRVPAGNRLAILTNGGGPGVLATDSLIAEGGKLADLRPETRERLEAKLGPAWSRGNPVDILADASGERYAAALESLLADRGADAVLVLQAPTSLAPSLEAAQAIAAAAHEPRIPVLACFMGGASGAPARQWLVEHGVPSYETPEAATRAFLHLVEYRRNRAELLETPPSVAEDVPCCDRDGAARAIESALAAGRDSLLESEAAQLLTAYGMAMADEGSGTGAASSTPVAAGSFSDATFGPVVFFGAARTSPDTGDRAVALPPLNRTLARHLIERTRVGAQLEARDPSGAMVDAVASTLVRVSQIAIDHGAVVELEIDPLLVGTDDLAHDAIVVAGAARVRVAPGLPSGEERLAIRPYPRELEGEIALRDGHRLPIRPIRPEDEPLLQDAFRHLTPEDVRLRFFSPLRVLHHDLAAQLAQIDYDRAMAFVVLDGSNDDGAAIVGVARLTADPDRDHAEYAVTVRSDWKGRGLGWALMRKMIDYARSKGIRELFGYVLRENETMLAMSRELGFAVTGSDEGPGVMRVSLLL